MKYYANIKQINHLRWQLKANNKEELFIQLFMILQLQSLGPKHFLYTCKNKRIGKDRIIF